jgi:hypothetical protein
MATTGISPPPARKTARLKGSIGFIVAGLLFGFYVVNSVREQDRAALTDEGRAIEAENAAIRSKLQAAMAHQPASYQGYVVRYAELEPLVDQALAGYKRIDEHRWRMAQQYKSTEGQQASEYLARMNTKDKEGLELLKQEVTVGKKLSFVPLAEQAAYFRAHIEPLQAAEIRIAREEMAIAKEAQSKGVALPDFVTGTLK